jgi:hypothetical protein
VPARSVRRAVVAVVTAVLVSSVLVVAGPGLVATAAGQTPEPPLTTGSSAPDPDAGQGVPPIIPEPNSGETPDDPGDRGGWQQLAVLGLVIGGLGLIAVLVVREGRRKRSRPAG